MELSPYVIRAPATSQLLAIDPECQDDPFYRYQTHQLVVSFQGKRALLTNLDAVAYDLQTSADYLATYLATNLNAAVKRDKAAAPRQGSATPAVSWTLYPATFTLDKINLCFRAFLTSFVLCPSCALPELVDIVADSPKPASPRDQEALLGSSGPPSSSPPSSSSASDGSGAKAKKTRAGAGKKAATTKSVTVRCQSCGWNEPLEKSLRRVKKNVKFVDYVLAHPPQQSSPTRIESTTTTLF